MTDQARRFLLSSIRIALTVIVMLNGSSTPAQGIVRFDEPTSQWYVANTYPQGNIENPNFIGSTTLRYFHEGDSLVAGETWSRMYSERTADLVPEPQFQGLVRQAGDVVLFMDDLGVIDTLYDFRMQAGDSMRYVSPFYDTYLPILAVDSILIQGIYHKVFHFGQYVLTLEDLLSDTWIEGIGSIHGPLAPRLPSTLGINNGFPDSTRVTCYAQDGTTLWSHGGYPDCIVNIALGVHAHDAPAPPLTLQPNPSTTSFLLTGIGDRPAVLRLLDLQGRVVLEANAVMDHRPVDAATLPTGAYMVAVTTADGGRQVLRWVKE